jgi:hypothetical protein
MGTRRRKVSSKLIQTRGEGDLDSLVMMLSSSFSDVVKAAKTLDACATVVGCVTNRGRHHFAVVGGPWGGPSDGGPDVPDIIISMIENGEATSIGVAYVGHVVAVSSGDEVGMHRLQMGREEVALAGVCFSASKDGRESVLIAPILMKEEDMRCGSWRELSGFRLTGDLQDYIITKLTSARGRKRKRRE